VIYIVYGIHVVICLFLILVVLLQQGKGADLSVFGGGSTQAAFGARGAATILHKMTVAGFVGFILTTITIGFMQTSGSQASVMSAVEEEVTEPVPAPVTDSDVVIEEAVDSAASELAIEELATAIAEEEAAPQETPPPPDEE
jgi:preprotein translocase subunit SecG